MNRWVLLKCNWDYISFGSSYWFRFFLGSNKVMQVALGRSASDEICPGIFKASKVCVPFFFTVVVLYLLGLFFSICCGIFFSAASW